MNRLIKIVFAITLISVGSLMIGCDDTPRIDASSEEAFEESLDKMVEAEEMSEMEEMEFGFALLGVIMYKADQAGLDMDAPEDEWDEELADKLDGMSIQDILDKADEIEDEDFDMGFGDMDMDMELDDDDFELSDDDFELDDDDFGAEGDFEQGDMELEIDDEASEGIEQIDEE